MAKVAKKKASKVRAAKPKAKPKRKAKGEKRKMAVLNGKTGTTTTYEKNGDKKVKKVKVVDQTKGSKWHREAMNRLNDLKDQIKRQCKSMGEGVHGIGLCLKLVRDDKLWKADGAGSFGDWIVQHTDMSRMTAYNMIAVATYLTPGQAGQFGPTLSYSIAKATDKAAAKELQKLAYTGVSAKEMENERLRQLRERDQESLPAKKRARGPRKVKRAVGVHNDGGSEDVEVDEREIERSARTRRGGADVPRGETGLHEIKPLKVSRKNKKLGWDLAVPKMQIGENGPVVKLWINIKEMRVKYKVI